jgi:hypothetical protein
MDYITLALVGLLLLFVGLAAGGWAGSRYRKCRLEGKTRVQALKGIVTQGGGGPFPIK